MNPDFDDYDDVPTEREETSRPSTLPRLVLGLAVVGFIALALYAYRSNKDSVQPGDLTTIQADLSAIKERPANPEGEQFPNKDKTIYDAISSTSDSSNKVEKLMPDSEEPVKPGDSASAGDDSKTWVNDAVKEQQEDKTASADDAVNAAVTGDVKSNGEDDTASANADNAAPATTSAAPATTESAKAAAKPAETKTAAPAKPVVVKPVAEKPVAKPAAKAAPATASTGSYKIQLGAFKSEDEATSTYKRILGKNGDVLSGKAESIVKADLPNGTYYRLRVGGFASADAAKAACTKLSGRGQGCFFAGH